MHSTHAIASFSPILTGLDSRYQIIELVARNGSSLVYRARDKVLDREVAIKTIKTQRFDQKQIVRFQAEAKTVSTLSHESLVRVLDFGITPVAQPYLVFDYVAGTTLQDFVRRHGPLPLEKAFSIVSQVCHAIAHAHKHGVVHRDLKSSNIMLTMPARDMMLAKVIDFGIAIILEDPSRGVTLTPNGAIVGSPAYMSPEQIQQIGTDCRSDIYSLACVLYEAIMGRVPFSGDSALEIMHRHVHQARPRLNVNKFPEDIGESLNEFFARALHVDREYRHQTIDEFHDHMLEIWDKLENSRKPEVKPYLESLSISDSHLLAVQKESKVLHLEMQKQRHSLLVIAMILSVVLLVFTILATIVDTKPLKEPPIEKPIDYNLKTQEDSHFFHRDPDNTEMRDLIITSADYALESEDIHPFTGDIQKMAGQTVDLDVHCNDLSNVNLSCLAKFPLESLELNITNITSEQLKQVCSIKTLQVLNVSKDLHLSADSFKSLKQLKDLKFFSASNCDITDDHIKELVQCKALTEIHLSMNRRLTPRSMELLATLPKLEHLHMAGLQLQPKDLVVLARAKHLYDLRLDGMAINDQNIAPLAELKGLRRLSLNYTDVTAQGLKPIISQLKDLEDLSVYGCRSIEERDMDNLNIIFPGCELSERQTRF